jgi:hypothetical protein
MKIKNIGVNADCEGIFSVKLDAVLEDGDDPMSCLDILLLQARTRVAIANTDMEKPLHPTPLLEELPEFP